METVELYRGDVDEADYAFKGGTTDNARNANIIYSSTETESIDRANQITNAEQVLADS